MKWKFTKLYTDVLQDSAKGEVAQALYCLLDRREHGKHGVADPGIRHMAHTLKVSESSIHRALRELKEGDAWLKIEERYRTGRTSIYHLVRPISKDQRKDFIPLFDELPPVLLSWRKVYGGLWRVQAGGLQRWSRDGDGCPITTLRALRRMSGVEDQRTVRSALEGLRHTNDLTRDTEALLSYQVAKDAVTPFMFALWGLDGEPVVGDENAEFADDQGVFDGEIWDERGVLL